MTTFSEQPKNPSDGLLRARTVPRASELRVALKWSVWIIVLYTAFSVLLVWGRFDLLAIGVFFLFIPLTLWMARLKSGWYDVFSPEIAFPVCFVLYMFIGTIDLPVESQLGLILPWTQWIYYIVGLLGYLIGTRVAWSTVAPETIPLRLFHSQNDRKFMFTMWLLFAAGIAARMVNIRRYGVPILHLDTPELRVLYVSGVAGAIALALEAVFICLMLHFLRGRLHGASRYLAVLMMSVVILDEVASADRGGFLRIGVASIVLAHYARRRMRLKSIVVAGVVAVLLVSAIGTYREYSLWGDAHIEKLQNSGMGQYTFWLMSAFESIRLPTEDFHLLTQQVPLFDSYRHGTVSLAALTAFLPGHRPGPGEISKKILGLDFVGFGASSTILGPLYVDDGVFGIFLGMFLFGMLSRFLYAKMLRGGDYIWVLIYSWFLQNQLKAIKDEMLPDLGVIWVIVLFVGIHLLCRKRSAAFSQANVTVVRPHTSNA